MGIFDNKIFDFNCDGKVSDFEKITAFNTFGKNAKENGADIDLFSNDDYDNNNDE